MSQTLQKSVVVVSVTALNAQPVLFGSLLESVQFINNGPATIYVLGHGMDVMFNVWPGDVFPYEFGDQDFNTLFLFADAPALAADIAAGNILYIKYKTKRRN